MEDRKQVTIRGVSRQTYTRLQQVRQTSQIPLGTLLDEAVDLWWNSLPEVDEAS